MLLYVYVYTFRLENHLKWLRLQDYCVLFWFCQENSWAAKQTSEKSECSNNRIEYTDLPNRRMAQPQLGAGVPRLKSGWFAAVIGNHLTSEANWKKVLGLGLNGLNTAQLVPAHKRISDRFVLEHDTSWCTKQWSSGLSLSLGNS